MRTILLILFILLATWLQLASATTIKLTIYDDGLSCPGGCDAHVVFDPSLNGTEFAHMPSTPTRPFSKCELGSECRICFVSDEQQCMNVMYRGAGPSKNTFDLTPSFYEKACNAAGIPTILRTKCAEFEVASASLNERKNCFHENSDEPCKSLIDAARVQQERDSKLYQECKLQGEAKYNAKLPISQRRSNDCAYELKGTGGPNSKGATWKRLLPGACRPGTYVGKDGLDCCNGNPFSDGPLGIECHGFYPKPYEPSKH